MSNGQRQSLNSSANEGAPPIAMPKVEVSRPRKSVLVGVHFPQSAIDALDHYIESDFNELKRPEAIRQIVKRWLVQNGHYKK